MKASTLTGHSNPIYTVISHPLQPIAYTAGNDKGIVEWSLEKKAHLRVFQDIQHTVYALEVIPSQSLLIAGCNNGSLCFFDLESTKLLKKIILASAIFCVKYIEFKNELVCTTDNGLVYIIDTSNFEIIHQFSSGNQKIRSFCYHQNLNLLIFGSNDEYIRIYNLTDYTLMHQLKANATGVSSVTFSNDGKYLLSGGRDAHLNIYEITDWSLVQKFPAHLFAIYQIIYHPYLHYFATASRDKSIKIWRSTDFSLFKNLSIDKAREGHLLSVNDICWSSDGNYLLSVSDDKLFKTWEFKI